MTALPPLAYLQVAAYNAQMVLPLVDILQQHVLLYAKLLIADVDSGAILLASSVSPVPFVETQYSNIAHYYLKYQ